MPKLKCIGGELDGQWHDVPDNLKYGDMVRLRKPQQTVDLMIHSNPADALSLDITLEYCEYYLSELTHNKPIARLQFLVMKGMNDLDAVKFQFEK